MKTCERIHPALSAYLDGEESVEESVAARAHLEACAGCRALLADWQAIEAALPMEQDAPLVSEAIVRAAPRAPLRRLAVPGVAAAMVALLAAGALLVAQRDTRPAIDPAATVTDEARALTVSPSEVPAPSREPSAKPTSRPATEPSSKPTAGPSERPTKDEQVVTRGSNGTLVLVLRIERRYARPGEPLRAEAVLRNVTGEPVTFSSPARSAIDLIIRDPEGVEVYRRSQAEGWEHEMVQRTLAPGELIEESFTFTAPSEPGGYLLAGQCLCMPEDFRRGDPPAKSPSGKQHPFETEPLKFAVGAPRD